MGVILTPGSFGGFNFDHAPLKISTCSIRYRIVPLPPLLGSFVPSICILSNRFFRHASSSDFQCMHTPSVVGDHNMHSSFSSSTSALFSLRSVCFEFASTLPVSSSIKPTAISPVPDGVKVLVYAKIAMMVHVRNVMSDNIITQTHPFACG
jgi:hypothetical protein